MKMTDKKILEKMKDLEYLDKLDRTLDRLNEVLERMDRVYNSIEETLINHAKQNY